MSEPLLETAAAPRNIPSIRNAKNLFIMSFLFVNIVGGLMQKYDFWIGLSLTEILLILVPTLVFLVKGKLSPRLVLRLNNPGGVALLIAVVLGLCVWPWGLWIDTSLSNLFSSKSPDILSAISQITRSNMLYRLLVFGFLASICEETLFRGYLQTAIENQLGVKQSISWTAILFSVYHFVPTTMIALLPDALLMCWICWRFNSIFPAMLVHFSNNFLAPYLFVQYGQNTLGWFHIIMLGSAVLAIITAYMTTRLPARPRLLGV